MARTLPTMTALWPGHPATRLVPTHDGHDPEPSLTEEAEDD